MESLSKRTRILHWLLAIAFIGMVSVGVYMSETRTFSLYPIHKSIGFIVFWLVLLRLLWVFKRKDTLMSSVLTDKPKRILAKASHHLLLLITLLFPISGMTMNIANGFGLHVFSWTIFATNKIDGKRIPLADNLGDVAHFVHGSLLWIFIITLSLHIAGALYHHFILKDETLKRMIR
jgi:cytochrome b561